MELSFFVVLVAFSFFCMNVLWVAGCSCANREPSPSKFEHFVQT